MFFLRRFTAMPTRSDETHVQFGTIWLISPFNRIHPVIIEQCPFIFSLKPSGTNLIHAIQRYCESCGLSLVSFKEAFAHICGFNFIYDS